LLKSYDDGLTKADYEYDVKGQRTKETTRFGTSSPVVKVIERSYEANGLLKTLQYPDARVQSYTYDTNNQLKTTKIPGLAAGNDTLTYSYTWNAIREITLPGNLKRTVTLDPLQRPTRIEVKGTTPNAVPIMNHQYAYDAVSNIKSKTTLDGAYRYDYDALDRLIEAQPPPNLQQVPSSLPIERFDYDAVHNRQSSGHQPGAWTYNANNELKAWGTRAEQRTITYDQNGSTTKEVKGEPASETTDYVYDQQDRLIEVKKNNSTVAKYAYDPMGRRIWRQTSSETTWFLYSDEGLIGEYTSSGAAIREYGWNPGGLWGTDTVWQKDANGTFLAHNDHLYTTDVLTKATDGSTAWHAVREAFVKTAVQLRAQTTYLMRFPGQWEDIVGFHQNWFKDYSEEVGRYIQADPIGLDGGINKFAYALARPVMKMDPIGPFPCFFGLFGDCGEQKLSCGESTSSWCACFACCLKRIKRKLT